MLGAALLESDTYEEVALAQSTRTHAVLVVVITSIAAGLGGLGAGPLGFIVGSITALAGWGLYVLVIYWAATARFGAPRAFTAWSGTLRVLGVAVSPRLFLLFAFVPGIGLLLGLAVHAWVLIATVPAVKSALDLDTRPAIATAAAGSLAMAALWTLVALLT